MSNKKRWVEFLIGLLFLCAGSLLQMSCWLPYYYDHDRRIWRDGHDDEWHRQHGDHWDEPRHDRDHHDDDHHDHDDDHHDHDDNH